MINRVLAVWELLKTNPLGAGTLWGLSGFQTMVTSAFPLSLAYPTWAQDLSTRVIEQVPVYYEVAKEIALEVLSNPP